MDPEKDAGELNPTDDIRDSIPEPELSWTVHPVRRRPVVSILVTAFIILVTAAVFYTTDSRVFGVLALVVMLLSLAKFYFPTRYGFDSEGVTIGTTTQSIRKQWSQYRSYYPDKNGVLLSPFSEPSRLENFRGLYIMTERDKREEVIRYVEEHIGKGRANQDAPVSDEDEGDE